MLCSHHSNLSLGTNVTPGRQETPTKASLTCERISVCNNKKLPADRLVSSTGGSFGSSYI